MRSTSKNADEVRTYYIQLEQLVDKYKDIIIESKDKEIKLLKDNQTKIEYPIGGVVYIAQTPYTDKSKLGITEDLNSRLNTYNTGIPDKTQIIYSVKCKDIRAVEKCVKLLLEHVVYIKGKEYYDCDVDLIIEKITKCIGFVDKEKHYIEKQNLNSLSRVIVLDNYKNDQMEEELEHIIENNLL